MQNQPIPNAREPQIAFGPVDGDADPIDPGAAARRRANELRAAGQAFGEAAFGALLNGVHVVETLERGFADLSAKIARLAAAIAERPAAPAPNSGAPPEELPTTLTVGDVAQLLKTSARTVRRKMAEEMIPEPSRLKSAERTKGSEGNDQGNDQKAAPKGAGLGKAIWKRETILAWIDAGCPSREHWKAMQKK